MLKHPKSSAVKQNLIIAFLVLVVIGATVLYLKKDGENMRAQIQPESTAQENRNSNSEKPAEEKKFPDKLSLKVPFTAQAPTANWDELHNEACEEASAIMANAYFNNISSLPSATVEKEITKLSNWQTDNLGYHLSINTDEVVKMIEANYNLKAETVGISEDIIKKALAENKLVIVPANGQMLGNPNFKQPGPVYHMFVITGYDSKNYITNDPGTRNGLNYKYTYQTIEAATGNWQSEPHAVDLTDKRIIIVSKLN